MISRPRQSLRKGPSHELRGLREAVPLDIHGARSPQRWEGDLLGMTNGRSAVPYGLGSEPTRNTPRSARCPSRRRLVLAESR